MKSYIGGRPLPTVPWVHNHLQGYAKWCWPRDSNLEPHGPHLDALAIISLHCTLFRSMTMLCGTNNIIQNIPHIQAECEKYFAEYCQSYRTLLWI